MLTKNGGVITNDGFPECIMLYNAHWRNTALQAML